MKKRKFTVKFYNREAENRGQYIGASIDLPVRKDVVISFLENDLKLGVFESEYQSCKYKVEKLETEIPLFNVEKAHEVNIFDLNMLAEELNEMSDEEVIKLGALFDAGLYTNDEIIYGRYNFNKFDFEEIPKGIKSDNFEIIGREIARIEKDRVDVIEASNLEEYGKICIDNGWRVSSLGYAIISKIDRLYSWIVMLDA